MAKYLVQAERRKLTNNIAKVEIALADYIYSQGNAGNVDSFKRASSQLEMLLADSKELENVLLSHCYTKLASW
jgi:hypothetical protein